MNQSNLFQIKLKSVLVNENGTIKEDVKGVNAVETSLIYPKEGVPSIISIRALELEDKVTLDYTTKPLEEQLLFKQSVQGESMLEVNLTAIEKLSKLESAVVNALGSAIAAVVKAISGVGGVTGVAKSVTKSLFKEKVSCIGTGSKPINKDTPDGDFLVDLKVPKKVKLARIKLNLDGTSERQTVTLEKGYDNGKVVFDIKRI
jgi:hypothetical protein